MIYDSLQAFLSNGLSVLKKGNVGLILMEDDTEVDSTLRHHLDCGFDNLIAVGVADIPLAEDVASKVVRIHHDMTSDNALTDVVNPVIKACPQRWIYYCYNAEYLFFPFCEHRSIGELATFCTEERRFSTLTYVVDLYAGDLGHAPSAVSLEEAFLDKSGYYALARKDRDNEFEERQLDFFGGLRWRFEEHIPMPRRRIDRIAFFRAETGLELLPDHRLSLAEFNTYACPWHHSPTIAICSFRTAKALKRNPGSKFHIDTFLWHNSAPFKWHSQQLLDLGLMEPGQWF
jgi:hypothetical protein